MTDIIDEDTATSSNDALTISLGAHHFHPIYTYPIFGDAEKLYGYENPQLDLEFDATNLLPLVSFSHGNNNATRDNSDGPVKTLMQFSSPDTHVDRESWEKARKADRYASPPGSRIGSFGDYVVYKVALKEAQELLKRLQIFVLFFIEGGSYIDETDSSWELYLVYQKGSHHFVGFATVYPYFYYESAGAFDLALPKARPVRKRISQFVILPPFQGQGVGQGLYSLLMDNFTKDNLVKQITVEDPNESFDDLRDRSDILRLQEMKNWTDLDLPLKQQELIDLAPKLKMVPRQIQRCGEMAMLARHPNEPANFKRLVKSRLFEKNYEGLEELDPATQRELIQKAYENVVTDYRRILSPFLQKSEELDGDEQPSKRLKTAD